MRRRNGHRMGRSIFIEMGRGKGTWTYGMGRSIFIEMGRFAHFPKYGTHDLRKPYLSSSIEPPKFRPKLNEK